MCEQTGGHSGGHGHTADANLLFRPGCAGWDKSCSYESLAPNSLLPTPFRGGVLMAINIKFDSGATGTKQTQTYRAALAVPKLEAKQSKSF